MKTRTITVTLELGCETDFTADMIAIKVADKIANRILRDLPKATEAPGISQSSLIEVK